MAKSKDFYSCQSFENKLEFSKIDGYTHFHYAIVQTRGIDAFFDLLRYERAFLARRRDLDALLESIKTGRPTEATFTNFEFLLAKFSWAKPNWTYNRLLSTTKLKEVSYPEIFPLGSNFEGIRSKPKLNVRSDITVQGTMAEVLEVMWKNHAMPASENDSNRLEHCVYTLDHPESIELTTFVPFEQEWKL